jgi:hypothetical protein
MNYKQLKEDTAVVLKKAATYTVGAAVIVGAVTIGIAYGKHVSSKPEKPTMVIQPSIKLQDVSVAINERNEMLIIDRKTGEYVTYEDSVGMAIFTTYAGKLYTEKNSK